MKMKKLSIPRPVRCIALLTLVTSLIHTASASVFLADPVATNTMYAANNKLYGKNPTNAPIIGFTNAWSGYDTSLLKIPTSSEPLAYPAGTSLTATGICFAVTGGATGTGRLVQRKTIPGWLPTSGTLYMSMLVKATSSTLFSSSATTATAFGLGTNARNVMSGDATNSNSTMTFPADGVYFGICQEGLALCVQGVRYPLVSPITANATYFCIAKIEFNANGTQERVSAIVNPASYQTEPTTWTTNCTADIVTTGSTFEYLNLGGATPPSLYFDEFLVADYWPHAAYLSPTIKLSADDTSATPDLANSEIDFTSKLSLSSTTANLFACFDTSDKGFTTNNWSLVFPWQSAPETNVAYTTSIPFSSLTTNTIYTVAAIATDGYDGDKKVIATFLNGEVSVSLKNDAEEEGCLPGYWTFSRPATATDLPLTVNYTLSSSTAFAGTNYINNLTGSVVIPAGAASVDLPLTPILNSANADVSVTLTLASGNYLIGSPSSAVLTINNYDVPTDRHVWIASSSGNASTASNWSTGTVPGPNDDIYLEHFTSANMTWDAGANGLPDTVKSWTQASSYTGIVTFLTAYTNVVGATFTNFTVTGDAMINGGTWTHPQSINRTSGSILTINQMRTNRIYRLCATIGGNFTLGSSGRIDVSGKGYYHNAGGVYVNPSHGGLFVGGSTVPAYGNPKYPEDIGFAACIGTDSASKRAAGGGAILLQVGGTATINGTLTADGGINGLGVGAGGSVLLQAHAVTGTGSILSEGPAATSTTSTSGVGGRIAVISDTSISSDTLTISASVVGRGNCGGCGTVFLKEASTPNGVLIVRDLKNTGTINAISMQTPVITEGDWTFDRVILGGVARLTVPTNTTLTLPGGLASVASSDATLYDGLLYLGGTLDIGSASPQFVQTNWVFAAVSNYVINADLIVRGGAAIGLPQIQQNLGSYVAPTNCVGMNLTVNGNLNVASDSFILGYSSGAMIDDHYVPTGYNIGAHGGRNNPSSYAYDSILNPNLPGLGQSNSYGGYRSGAVLKLLVTGTLTLNGQAQTDEHTSGFGSAGTVNFTLGSLAGTGTISAKATKDSGAGRIAIRLTNSGATFDAFGITNILAIGPASAKGSAGTIYLETADNGLNAGTIIVRNTSSSTSTNSTPIPANGMLADTAAALAKTSLIVSDKARVDFSTNLQFRSASMSSGTVFNLNGKTVTVKSMTAGGANVAPGVYTAGSSLFTAGYLIDTSTGGTLIVRGSGTTILIR